MVEDRVETACVMVEHSLEQLLPHFEFDFAAEWEDICYKAGPVVSPYWFKRVIVPRYKRIHEKLKVYGIDFWWMDCDGDIRPILEAMMEGGVNCLFPYEVNSCEQPSGLLERYGRDLRIMGGFEDRDGQGAGGIQAYMKSLAPLVN
jgi:uroporphyrinogen decarboxylase